MAGVEEEPLLHVVNGLHCQTGLTAPIEGERHLSATAKPRRVKRRKSYAVSGSAPSEGAIETAAFAKVRGRHYRSDQMKFLTITEVAERLQVANRTVRRWVKAGVSWRTE